jgi:hypothetical protein
MAAAIGCWVRDTAIVENQRDILYKNACLNAIITNTSHLDTRVPGQQTRGMLERAFDEKKKMQDHMWVLKG